MPSLQTVLWQVSDNVGIITLNRPEVYNAVNEQMQKELSDILKEAENDRNARCLILRGAGNKAFCSGQDLKEHRETKRSLKESLVQHYNPIIRKIRTIEKPVIAMVNGVAAGAGCSIALACDMRFMAESAKLIEVFVRIGLIPDSGSHWFLPRLTGMARAFEYAATGRDISAAEAERVGLVNRVVPGDRLEDETLAVARQLAYGPTKAIGLIKRAINKSLSSDLDTILDYEACLQQTASETDDHREGVEAFIGKRPATFQGR